jgi:hypothetical protein
MVPRGVRAQRAAVRVRVTDRSTVVRRLGCVVAVAVALAACDGGSGSESKDESTTTRGTDASTSTTEDTTSVTVGIICRTAPDASSALVAAWTSGDRAAAARCATDSVVNQLFETNGAGNTWTSQGCDTTDPNAPVCAYSYEGGGAFFTVEGSDAAGWKVTMLEFVAD